MAKAKAATKERTAVASQDRTTIDSSKADAMVFPPGLCAEQESLGFVEPPPGLAPPPGLSQASKPTGEDVDEADFVLGGLKVLVTGLPNSVLSELMVEAILQQAGLSDGVVGFRVKPGKPCGKMAITVKDFVALDLVMNHFRGCTWDTSGEAVKAVLISDIEDVKRVANEVFSAAAPDLGAMEQMVAKGFSAVAFPRCDPMDAGAAFAAEAVLAAEASYAAKLGLAASFATSSLSTDAKLFTPSLTTNHSLSADAPVFEPRSRGPSTKLSGLSSSAPVFVPGASFDAAARASTPAAGKMTVPVTVPRTVLGNSSEMSTEAGDSDPEEEKDMTAGVVVA